ncbi:MAG: hypothetical protein JWP97_6382 [Labilithrix sp.]|nr:hypothetical protein [Labilithrix sp.]
MSNLRTTIEALASQFATSVLDALRSASIDELVAVAGGAAASASASSSASGSGSARRGPGRPRRASSAGAESPSASSSSSNSGGGGSSGAGRAAKRGRGGRLGRRSAGDISQMIDSIVSALAKSAAGLRAEQIRETLGVEAKELPRPLAEALEAGRITKSGQKRATTYFAAGSGGGSTGGGKRGGGRKAGKSKR